jgi:hypothetical protein
MTIVVTTASQFGITVVGDRALSSMDRAGTVSVRPIRKVYYSAAANVSFAFWGSASVPSGDMGAWMQDFVARVSSDEPLDSIGNRLAAELEAAAIAMSRPPSDLRRGVHLGGFVGAVPHLYHVHTGSPATGVHAPKLLRDFPFEHVGDEAMYAADLRGGSRAQLRNGMPTLFGLVADSLDQLRLQLAQDAGVQIPAPTLLGQLAVDRALVRFAANLLAASDNPPTVSEEVDCLAFNSAGLVTDSCTPPRSSVGGPIVAKAQPTRSLA